MSKVIVTGANGFLGSWLCKRLVTDGHDVTALVRKGSDCSELSGINVHYLYGDITDKASLLKNFVGFEAVFHLAGLIAYKHSDRFKMEVVNVQGTRNVVEAVQECKVGKLIHLSSVVAIGASLDGSETLNENSPYTIGKYDFGYFETKRKAEQIVREAVQQNGLQAIIVNPSTIYGAGDAKKSSRSTQLKVAKGKFPFIPLGGVNVVAVEDVVNGIILAWQKGRIGERYILCGENLTIEQLFKTIAEIAKVPPPKIHLPKILLLALGWLGDLLLKFGYNTGLSLENAQVASMFHWFDCNKAKAELGFQPGPARLAIQNSVSWILKNESL